MTAVIYHELFGRHLEGYSHVESPERYHAVMRRLRDCPATGSLEFIEAARADKADIERVHSPEYVQGILSLDIDQPVVLDWGDTVATRHSVEAALYSAGAGIQAARLVAGGKSGSAFCAGRPPGHHAERDRAMGFCIFNNVAVAAAWLLEEAGSERVAIVDWDIHHGNGTERIFVEDPRVLYVSIHQYPHYPGTGHEQMTGRGKGSGYTLNIPVGAGAGHDRYMDIFDKKVVPALDGFGPDFLLISAGFDGHADDPLSSGMLTNDSFAEMTRALKGVAERHSGGRIVSFLEGGYDLEALAGSVEAHISVLAGR